MARTIRTVAAASSVLLSVAASLALAGCTDDDDEPQRDPSGNVTETAAAADVFDVQVGDCVGDFADDEEVTDVAIGPCEEEHAQEVFAITEVPDGQFPGDEAFRTQAEQDCQAEFATFIGVPWQDSELDYTWLQPTQESWEQGDREIVCLVYDPAGVTGSLQGAGR